MSTKCDDAPQLDVMVNFSGPGVAELARNKKSMPDGGELMTYGVGASSEVTGVGGGVTGAGEVATGADGTITGAAGAGVEQG